MTGRVRVDGLCVRGHEMVGRNVYVRPNGDKRCRACKSLSSAARARGLSMDEFVATLDKDWLGVPVHDRVVPAACRYGHPYDEVNTGWYRGMRKCRQCRRDAQARQRRSRGVGVGAAVRRAQVEKALARVDEIEFLLDLGESTFEINRMLGIDDRAAVSAGRSQGSARVLRAYGVVLGIGGGNNTGFHEVGPGGISYRVGV